MDVFKMTLIVSFIIIKNKINLIENKIVKHNS